MSILPLSCCDVKAEHEGMTTRTENPPAPDSTRARDRVAARLLATALDQRLAAGANPADSALLAARASQLASPVQRQRLTRGWLAVLDRAARPRVPLSPRVPLRRAALGSAQGDIRLMLAVVQGRPVVGIQGIALARTLLTDGTGALYNARSGGDLAVAVRDATRLMLAN